MTTRRGSQRPQGRAAAQSEIKPTRRRRPPQQRRIPWKALIPLGVLLVGIAVAILANYFVSVKSPGDIPILQVNSRSFPWRYYVTLVRSEKLQADLVGARFDAGRAPYEALQSMAENELLRQGAPREGLHVIDAGIKASMLSRLGVDTTGTDQGAIERDFQVRLKNQLAIAQMPYEMYREQVESDFLKEQMRTKLGENIPHVQAQNFMSIIKVADQQAVGQVQERFKKGDSFEAIAREMSVDPSGKDGGQIGWTPRLVYADYADFFFGLDVGEVSAPIPTVAKDGFYVVRLLERQDFRAARLHGILVKDASSASAIQQRLDHGEQFDDVAASAANLDGILRGKRGDMGLVKVGDFGGIFDSSIRGFELNKITDPLNDSSGSGTLFFKITDRSAAAEVSDANFDILKQRALKDWLRREQANNHVNFCPAGTDNCFGSKKVEALMSQIGNVSFTKFQQQLTATAVAASKRGQGGFGP